MLSVNGAEMIYTAIIAEASRQPGIATTSGWLVPLITGGAGLLGTVIGGIITYTSTRSADNRKEAALARREDIAHIKDVAVRFLVALSSQNIDSLKLEDFARKTEGRIETMLNRLRQPSGESQKSDDQGAAAKGEQANEYLAGLLNRANELRNQAVEAKREQDEVVKQQKREELRAEANELEAEVERLQDLVRTSEEVGEVRDEVTKGLDKLKAVIKALGEVTETAKVPDAILGEMYLILPTTTLRKAEKAASAVLRRQLTAYLPAEDQPKESEARDAINAFVADIRRLLGKEKLIPEVLGSSQDFDSIVKRILDIDKLKPEMERLGPEIERLKPQLEKLKATESSDAGTET
jgi:hypothetical protein